jgi:hypothetical protein
MNAAWGVDFGIYYGLTNSFIESKELINPYSGWGNSYQYFPVLYAITGILHFITGIEVISLMPKIAPIIGGLTIPIFYFIVQELFKDKKIALLSAGLLSVATFHVYQTSHAAPLTVGHFFMMLSFYFFIKYIKKEVYFIPLVFSTVLLILSHHFTTYFYLISITFMLFFFSAKQKKIDKHIILMLIYVSLASTAAFSYWALIATPVYNSFMSAQMFLQPQILIIIYYGLIYGGVVSIIRLNRIYTSIKKHLSFNLKISKNRQIIIYFFILLFLAILVSFTGVPGVYVKLTPIAILYSLPMIFLISFSFAGLSHLKSKSDGGTLVNGWIFAILISFLFSIITASLFPDRHLEYLIIPLCIPAAMCLNELLSEYKSINVKKTMLKSIYKPALLKQHRREIAIIGCFAILFASNMMVAYPTIDALNTLDERVSNPCINSLEWIKGNVTCDNVIASDHRLSMLFWAEGYNITYGQTNDTWNAENLHDYIDEIEGLNISYIIIDDIMREKVINIDVGKYYYFTNNSYNKFNEKPFELIYRNATLNNLNEEIHWIEIYKINHDLLTAR